MVNKLMDGVSFLKSRFQTDELEEKLNQAVSEQNWQASTQLLHEIANASYNYEKEQRIAAFIWDKLKHKSWKKVLKTLHLVDFLAKNGPTSLVKAFKENIYEFRNFDNYTLVSEGIDRGESIRKQSKVIVDTLSDDAVLSEQRSKAKKIKQRMSTVIGSGAYYGNFSNDGNTGTFKKDTYESFGSNNYQYKPSNTNSGMSFGETVMKTLHQSKRTEQGREQVREQVKQQSKQVEVPPTKLNLSKMNERKPEQSKKLFTNLNSKLVKPPQKKVQKTQKIQKPTPTVKITPQPKKVNIMDLDLVGFNEEPTKPANNNPNNSLDPFDFLASTPPQNKTQQQAVLNLNLTHSYQPSASLPQSKQQPISKPIISQPTLASTYLNGSFNPPASQFTQPLPNNISLSLNTPQSVKKEASTNLIDFSNFREELNLLGQKQQKKSIVEEWNW